MECMECERVYTTGLRSVAPETRYEPPCRKSAMSGKVIGNETGNGQIVEDLSEYLIQVSGWLRGRLARAS